MLLGWTTPAGFGCIETVEIDQIETFLAVATFGGFHRAAEALSVSQPAVSARIKALEQSLGATLFTRSRRGLTLSDAGKTLRPHAEQLLRTAALARQAIHELRPGSGGPLQIAAALSISVYFLPDVLKRFQQAYPNHNITIRSGHSKEVLEMVLGEQALLLVAHSTRGPKHTRRPRLAEVANWPLIFFDRGSSDWTLTHSLFRRAGLVPNVAFEVDTIETAKRMVERGLGLAFLPQLAVGREIRTNRLSIIKMLDAEPLGRSLDVIHPRRRPLTAEARAFLQVVRDVANEDASVPSMVRSRRRRSR